MVSASQASEGRRGARDDEGGHQIEPELDGLEPLASAATTIELEPEVVGDDGQQSAELQRRFKVVARQAALDPDDGIQL